MHIPSDQEDFLKLAFSAYDRKACISSLEIYSDLRNIFRIKKLLKHLNEGKEINIRQLVNHFVVLFNQFGSDSVSLLFYKIESPVYRNDMYRIISFLGRWDTIWDGMVDINTGSRIESLLTTL